MRDDSPYRLQRGSAPLLVSVPHAGTLIPDDLRPRLRPQALQVEDTDWHLEAVYGFVLEAGCSLLVPRLSRYVVDLNRPPQDTPMYPGANNTGLCPTRAFSGEALYRDGEEPGAAEVAQRLARYWQPYHDALEAELRRLQALHGYALLWDGHSIRSRLPWLFDGVLPDLNLGTADTASCAPELRRRLAAELAAQGGFSHAVDGRFKGGYITRHYGRPRQGWHAVQLEMCFSTYMQESPPFRIDDARRDRLLPLLRRLIGTMLDWRPDGSAA